MQGFLVHYTDVIMGAMAFQITSLTIVYSTVYSGADEIKHESPASLAFVWGIHRWPVNSPHKWPVTRKMFPFDDVFMSSRWHGEYWVNCGPSDAIWRQRSESTMVHIDQVMAWCLTAPSHYLQQCWLIITEVLWSSPEGNFTGKVQGIYLRPELKFELSKITTTSVVLFVPFEDQR